AAEKHMQARTMRRAEARRRGADEGSVPPQPLPPAWFIPLPLACVLLAATVFRATYLLLYANHRIFFDGLVLDARMYDSWAWSLAQGEWNSGQVFYFAPLYPFVLGALYTVIGHSLMAVYLLQSLLGLANLVLLYRIGLATFGARAGLLAAGMASLYGPFAFFETKVLGATLGLVLNVAALALLVSVEREELAGK